MGLLGDQQLARIVKWAAIGCLLRYWRSEAEVEEFWFSAKIIGRSDISTASRCSLSVGDGHHHRIFTTSTYQFHDEIDM
jgi:hypothetical protein